MAIAARSGAKSPRVLIVHGDPNVLKFLADSCAMAGLEVHTASNGLHALAAARRTLPDILIVDVNMPELYGLSLRERLLASEKKPINVIVVTGDSHAKIVERCETSGAIYARKGPEPWSIVHSTLMEFFPYRTLPAAKSGTLVSGAQTQARPRVLIVDDDPDVGQFLSSRFRDYGLEASLASDGVSGYLMARREKPSLVISDFYMPHGDAFYLLWKLRSTPATEKTPVFIISGRRLDETMQANLQREFCGHPGAAKIFMKPLDFEEIIASLQNVRSLGGGERRPALVPAK
jgi:DNA-binding response OmpR family regulator